MRANNEGNETENPRVRVSESNNHFEGWGYRHQQCLILFVCLTTAYSMRACMGVALVAMVEKDIDATVGHNITMVNETNETLFGISDRNVTHSHNLSAIAVQNNENVDEEQRSLLNLLLLVPPYPKLRWTKNTQDTILSSFFWGYMLLQVPAGQLAHKYGARALLAGALFINCVTSFCLPWAAYYGGWVTTAIFRIIQGLSQACILPGMHTIFGKWTPLGERGRLSGWAYGGQALGTVLGLPMTGFIASSPLGWPGIFRFYAIISGIVGAVIYTLGADTPAQHPKISAAERFYIENELGTTTPGEKKKYPVPWSKILRCRGLYAIVVAHIGQTWGQLTLYSEVPAFMDKVIGVNIKTNGLLTALPFLVMWFTNFFFTWFTDMLIVKKILSATNTRKLANSLGAVPAAAGLVVLAYAPKNIYVVEVVLVVICAFKIAGHVGFQVNHIDISSNFSGTMMSISNFVSNLVGSTAPIVAGLILTDVSSEYLWRRVFFVSAGFYFITNLFYVLFATAERADWDNLLEGKEEKETLHETEPIMKETIAREKNGNI